ncbi:hypothetical protein EJB05_25353 [Eragrostis curvula]|uniref:Ubiquitin-like protease family profile domain-containing protein n=1 Tax=Eragrostis curvula TaxID=38414 RepID=A0A5J9VF67_9POAL|nr:hypothetical protein EJB05_25353 [Eragrostis curvula]
MGNKRGVRYIEVSSAEDADDTDSNDGNSDAELYGDDDMSDGVPDNLHVLRNCMREYNKIKMLKNKMVKDFKKSMQKRQRIEKESKEAFTRFSVTSFSNVISALNSDQMKVLEKYGFTSLLKFDKCYVPNRFVKWVARSVDHKSGDIILDGKVISLTRESLHMVLKLPLGSKPFPSNTEAGKLKVFSLFGLSSMPLTSVFADKIIKHDEMSDEKLVICFLLVAMGTFLCPNTSLKPSSKYFGIFLDLENWQEYDCCGFVLDWLLERIRTFKMGKQINANDTGNSLGGCWYYLAVLYLDHVDFGSRQPPDTIPRILVWKQDMIKSYSDLDEKSHGVYGLRPLLDRSVTCYAKTLIQPESLALSNDSDFLNSLDLVCGCKLPNFLKMDICNLIETYTINSSLSVNLDLTALNPLPDNLKRIFSKLLNHISSVEHRSKSLVLEVLKLLNDSANSSQQWSDLQTNSVNEDSKRISENGDGNNDSPGLGNIAPQPDLASADIQGCASQLTPELPVPNLSPAAIKSITAKTPNVDLEKVLDKLSKHSTSTANVARAHAPTVLKSKPSMAPVSNAQSTLKNQGARKPFKDISNASNHQNSVSFKETGCSRRDFIDLDGDLDFVPDSLSPNPPDLLRRLFMPKVTPGSDRFTPMLHQRTPIHMQSLNSSPDTPQKSNVQLNRVTQGRSIEKESVPSQYRPSKEHQMSPEVQFIGERSLFDKVLESTRKSKFQYNDKLHYSQGCSNTENIAASRINLDSLGSRPFPRASGDPLQYDRDVHSSGGKLPLHGPRRFLKPSLNKSEVLNYQAICELAKSDWRTELAFDTSGVKCTYWSLGDSLKPGGQVNGYVVSAYCYHLFTLPNGRPELSKRHYFFSSIGENLLLEPEQANDVVLKRGFEICSKGRPLSKSNLLFFPTCYDNHWFVFVVDIVDHNFVFLDPFYSKDDAFQVYVRDRMIYSFMIQWDKYVGVDMKFDKYDVIYPLVPAHSEDNMFDSGIISMMCVEYWISPRVMLSTIFSPSDAPNIRVKIANNLLFNPRNKGNKNLVIAYMAQVDSTFMQLPAPSDSFSLDEVSSWSERSKKSSSLSILSISSLRMWEHKIPSFKNLPQMQVNSSCPGVSYEELEDAPTDGSSRPVAA